jgi:sigma-54 dependent transcriptional regulator, acetoin dehydrogenase operon transcriptional activator AcoR
MITRLLGGRSLTPAALQRLLAHRWPGNLRELRNVLDYAASSVPTGRSTWTICRSCSLGGCRPAPMPCEPRGDGPHDLLQALRTAHWNVSAVARQMGLSRMTLYRRMKRGIVASFPRRQDRFRSP